MKNALYLLTIALTLITAGCASHPQITQEQKDRDSFYKEMMTENTVDLSIEDDEAADRKAANVDSWDKDDIDAEIESELR